MAEAAQVAYESTALGPRESAWNEICELGLQSYVADMDAHGYCIIPPEIVNPNNLAGRLREALLDVAERRNGERPDVVTGATHANRPALLHGFDSARYGKDGSEKEETDPALLKQDDAVDSPFGDGMALIFNEEEVFAEAVMNPPLLAMVTYMVGHSAVLSSMGCWMKGPCRSNFALHSDTALPNPLPSLAYQAQCTYVLTDFDRQNGATCIVPGSHKWCRRPTDAEAALLPYEEGGKDQAVVCNAAPGSLIIWHGNTWHGAFNRVAPGLRVSMTVYFVRHFIRPLEDYIDNVPQKLLDKYGPRFANVLQQGSVPGAKTNSGRVANTARAEKFRSAYEQEIGIKLNSKGDAYS